MGHNGWFPDGPFVFLSSNFGRASYSNVADLSRSTPLGQGSVGLTTPIFARLDPVLGPIGNPPPLDPPEDVTLHASSNAIDAGEDFPNVNGTHRGAAPDLGAVEFGDGMPWYGVRDEISPPPPVDSVPPSPPVDLRLIGE